MATGAVYFDFTMGSGGTGGTGNVVGPASATDNALARFDGTTGKLLQNSGVTLGDSQELLGVAEIWQAEVASVSPVVGHGTWWTKSDTPNNPYFTDDAGASLPILVAPSSYGSGDLLSGTVTANRPSRLALGTQYQVLRAGAAVPEYAWQGVIDHAVATLNSTGSTTTNIPIDDTTPLYSEGAQIISVSYTPKSTSNKLIVFGCVLAGHTNSSPITASVALFKDGSGTDPSVAAGANSQPQYGVGPHFIFYTETATATSSQTWSIRGGESSSGTFRWNGAPFAGTRLYGDIPKTFLIVLEVAA